MHRSARGGHLVAADDSGQVHLLNYPCVIDKAPRKELGGHCSHVPNVRWLAGDRRVVSAGGHDRTLFQWAVEGDDDTPPDFGAAAKGADKAMMAAARKANAKKATHDSREEILQQKLTHKKRTKRGGGGGGGGSRGGGSRGGSGVAGGGGGGGGKLRTNLHVKELQGVVSSYSAQLRALQAEIYDLELQQVMDEEREAAIAAEGGAGGGEGGPPVAAAEEEEAQGE